jgi:hypothetical protein
MENKAKKSRKETIPKALKDAVWNIWIGETIGKTKCMCCELKEITQNSFDCGHVDAEANGGKLSPMNLRPVCSVCNKSMGTENMGVFKEYCGFGKVETLHIKADKRKSLNETNLEKLNSEEPEKRMMKTSFDIIGEKKKQDYIVYQKIKPCNHEILKNLILDFDLEHSLLRLIRENSSSYENIKNAYRKFLIEREAFLNKMTKNL